MVLQQIFLGIVTFINFLIGFYVLTKNRRNIVNLVFFIFSTGIAIWSGGLLLLSFVQTAPVVYLVLCGGIIMILGFVLLGKVFPEAHKIHRKFLFVLVPFFCILTTIPLGIFVKGVIVGAAGELEPINGPAFPVFVATVCAYVFLGLYLFVKTYRRISGFRRLQMQYLLVSASIFVLFSIISDAILPEFGIFSLNLLGPMSSIIFVGFTAYAIVRHQLMDIRVVIQSSAIYSTLLMIIVGFYLAAIFILETIFQKNTSISIILSAGLTTILGIFGVPSIETYFRHVTDRIFFKEKYEYSDAIHELSETLNKNLDPEKLVQSSLQTLVKIFKVAGAHMILPPQNLVFDADGTKRRTSKRYSDKALKKMAERACAMAEPDKLRDLDQNEIECRKVFEETGEILKGFAIGEITSIVLDEKLLAVLVMGRRRSGDAYTSEDLKLLKTFAYQAAVAIEKAELYKKVKDYSRELEERVKERTMELEQLHERQRNMMIDISHALQTPLTVVKTELDVLKKQLPSTRDVETFERSIDHVSRLTYDLLKLARLETSRADFRKTSVNLSKLLCELVEYFTVLAEDKGITVSSKISPDIHVFGERGGLEELATNLLSNAVKYMPKKGRKRVKIELVESKEKKVVFTVADTGIGIHKKDLPHIFERFYRAKEGQELGMGGTGLGLAICKVIVQKHGGTINVQSKPGRGTKFTLLFPAV